MGTLIKSLCFPQLGECWINGKITIVIVALVLINTVLLVFNENLATVQVGEIYAFDNIYTITLKIHHKKTTVKIEFRKDKIALVEKNS